MFNYFHSKKDLYVYLLDYSAQIIEQLVEQIDLNETDIFKRIEHIGWKKLHIQQKYPQVFDFLVSTQQVDSVEVKKIIQKKVNPIYDESTEKLYEQIDYSKFKEGIDIEKALEVLHWTMNGFGEKGLAQIDTFESVHEFGEHYLQDWKKYSELLKESFYK